MARYFLTGSTGMVGGALLPRLQELGHDVVTDLKYFDKEKWNTIIHLAAVTNIELEFNPWLIETNIILAKKMLRYPARVIFGSSCSAQFLTNPYAYTKRYGEHICELHGNALALRFHNIYGPGARRGIVWWLMQQKSGAKLKLRGPWLVRDYIHVDDVVHFISMAVSGCSESQTGVVDVGTGVGTDTLGLVSLYCTISGKKFSLEEEPPGDNEPKSMISNNIVPHMSLDEGLRKLIQKQ